MLHLMELREAIVQKIKDEAIPEIGNSVFENRSTKVWPEESASVNVYDLTTPFSGRDRQPRYMQGLVEIVCEVIVQGEKQGSGGPGDILSVPKQLDILGQGVINALIYPWDSEIGSDGLGPLGGLADDCWLDRIEKQFDPEGETTKGAQRIFFTYHIQELLPNEAPQDTFSRLHTDIETPDNANAESLDIEEEVELNP